LAANAADVDRARAVARIGDHRHQRLFFNLSVLIGGFLYQFSWRRVYLDLKNILRIPMLIPRFFVKLAGAHNLNGKIKDIWRAEPRLEQLELSSCRNSLDSIPRTFLRLILFEDQLVLGAS
jgi:hypothetical protein